MSQVKLFSGFERFWHWAQALLIFGMITTGFEIHGTYALFGFEKALDYHIILAWTLIGLWAFAIFWHLTTGEWRQYVPTGKGLIPMMLYYAYGIFSGEAKPYHTTRRAKHNPLQRLAYFGFKIAIAPAIWISGLLLLFYVNWKHTALGDLLSLQLVALVHTAAVFALLIFLVAHIYMASTTGHPWYSLLKSMVTGYEELEDER
jgi:thiosulfate reductase cytochrome b subunit